MEPSPLTEIIKSVADIHQTQHQAVLELCTDQELCFQNLQQAQAEDWKVLQSLVQSAGTPAAAPVAAPAMPHITLSKIGLEDEPEAFVKLFKHTAEA